MLMKPWRAGTNLTLLPRLPPQLPEPSPEPPALAQPQPLSRGSGEVLATGQCPGQTCPCRHSTCDSDRESQRSWSPRSSWISAIPNSARSSSGAFNNGLCGHVGSWTRAGEGGNEELCWEMLLPIPYSPPQGQSLFHGDTAPSHGICLARTAACTEPSSNIPHPWERGMRLGGSRNSSQPYASSSAFK